LEKSDQIAPEIGASIGIMPNGARVLAQLGLFEEIKNHIKPLSTAHITFPDGFAVESRYPQVLHTRLVAWQLRSNLRKALANLCIFTMIRFGYPLAFLRRREFLAITYNAHPDKTKILTGKDVVELKGLSDGVCAVTSDGSVYEGNIIVGADGVHSRVRSEIWRWADKEFPGSLSATERNSKYPLPSPIAFVSREILEFINTPSDGVPRYDSRICLCLRNLIGTCES
jgi:FAD dependent monooxygenase